MLASQTRDPVFETAVRDQLDRIESALVKAADADSPMVREAAQHVILAGGKRFRPLLVVLASHLGPAAVDADVERAAVVVELTHVASLYHDDVMDEAGLRRGSVSANSRWGNTVAILVGDLLFARASDLVADLGPEFVRLQARTFARLVQGQLAETVGPTPGQDRLRHYLQVVADKTGSLIATSALFGAKLAGATAEQQRTMAEFGEQVGVVFQLSDDIIDITSDETGKTPGTDLREGIPTLPTLLARTSTDPADARLLTLLDSDLSSDADLAEVLGLLRRHRSIDEARAEVRRRAESARLLLDGLPAGPARTSLEELCDSVVSRTV
ncbi:heptaprenyl diphosphate synthase [Microlunatus sagamiharensis]|uniref:Heptaprenyl diphosphate synthase n=1 Tax=Microlunatus sagamiharensis TaxID=546874 RepID=A0A1H2MYM6_9ACTN|nr:polyprenyl synthetase family protein [Microlunatus sagamiharensis]SDU98224.1 heptaprenyl diphosphate synthase [Microlunatus sagamiharensis]